MRVDKFSFLVHFIIMDYSSNEDTLILLGRPFIATGRTLIEVEMGEISMRVNGQQMVFNILNTLKYPE